MGENDAFSFCPHIGIATGRVIVGYVGTPMKYNCSVFGAPVALAARCAGIKPEQTVDSLMSCSIAFPAMEWGDREFVKVFPPTRYKTPDDSTSEEPVAWELRTARTVQIKNPPNVEIREIVKRSKFYPQQTAEEKAKEALKELHRLGRFWPKDT